MDNIRVDEKWYLCIRNLEWKMVNNEYWQWVWRRQVLWDVIKYKINTKTGLFEKVKD